MKIDVRTVSEGQSYSFSHKIDLSSLDFAGRILFSSPVSIDGTIQKRNGVVTLTADWTAEAEFRCDRCDTGYTRALSRTVECVLREGDTGDREDMAPLTGGVCDLGEIMTPYVILSLESKNICADDCGGDTRWIIDDTEV